MAADGWSLSKPRWTAYLAALALSVNSTLAADEPTLPPAASKQIDFARDIRPLFAKHCLQCHGPEKHEGGLRLDRKDNAFHGGDSGPAFETGKSADSLLIRYVSGIDPDTIMPPKGERLTAEQVGLLRAWIDRGAAWRDDAATETPKSTHWSFQPIRRPPIPRFAATRQRSAPVSNPIDAFILAKLQSEGVAPSPEADRATLIRRLSLDLLGLPPTPDEVDAFLHDESPDAYERLVDRLLASPHFGEHWGRHWLDLARYADSDGYEKDLPRANAWRWRNWVIDAFNRDPPFDQFTIEQLAGDLLPDATLEQKLATGFHRNTLTNREGGIDKREDRDKQLVDRTNTTATVWMGVTLGCTQCHSHKYDPFTQREYYQFYAFFNQADETDVSAASPAELAAYEEAKRKHAEQRVALAAAVEELEQRVADQPKSSEGSQPAAPDPELLKAKKALEAHDKKAPKPPAAAIMAFVQSPKPEPTHIHLRGDFLQPGAEVEPGMPAALNPFQSEGQPDRLDLARWLVSPEHPLTRRVEANRVWQHLFGKGLVETTEDFGTQGERPSHPELLDWLASEYLERGWSRKAMIRLIVTSATYRQSSAIRADLEDRDPKNTGLARQNRFRMPAEIVRDVCLSASGLLNEQIGGPSIRPPLPEGVANIGYANSVKWPESKGADRYRRGCYIFFQRTVPYPMLMSFDSPDANVTCTRRERSNTPLQALTLLNDPVFFECAQALGERMLHTTADPQQRVRSAFRYCLGREPLPSELQTLTRLYLDYVDLARATPDAAKLLRGQVPAEEITDRAAAVAFGRVLLNLDEFVTRE